MSRLFLLAGLALVFSVSAHPCFTGCPFVFCDHKSEFWMPIPGVAFTGPICYRYSKVPVGVIGKSGEAHIVLGDKNRFIPISKWNPPGLRLPFSPSFFKTFPLLSPNFLSGVGRETYQSEYHRLLLDRRCFILPLKAWQVLDQRGNVLANKRSDYWHDCIAFRTRTIP